MCIRDSIRAFRQAELVVFKALLELVHVEAAAVAAATAHLHAVGPVSYTHLDVYKRQVENRLNIDIPTTLEVIIFVFVFAAEILGELQSYFIKYSNWDTILHTSSGFLCAAVGFSLVDLLNRSDNAKVQLSPGYLAITAFCFSMTIGILWEFIEFSADRLFLLDMQKDTIVNQISSVSLDPTNSNISITVKGIKDVILVTDSGEQALGLGGFLDIGLYDTMEDLFVNFVGAVVFSVAAFFECKSEKRPLTTALTLRRKKKPQNT